MTNEHSYSVLIGALHTAAAVVAAAAAVRMQAIFTSVPGSRRQRYTKWHSASANEDVELVTPVT